MKLNKGFTLTELLVVVLIIGVLTAVALPKYQAAVDKSRYAGMMPIAKSIASAQEAYLMSTGKYATNLEYLDVQLPNNPTGSSADVGDGITVEISELDNYDYVKVSKNNLENNYIIYQDKSDRFPGEIHCEALSNSSRAERLCTSLGGRKIEGSLTSGYDTYVMVGEGMDIMASVALEEENCIADGGSWNGSECRTIDTEEECDANGGFFEYGLSGRPNTCWADMNAFCDSLGGELYAGGCKTDEYCYDGYSAWSVGADEEANGCSINNSARMCEANGGYYPGDTNDCYEDLATYCGSAGGNSTSDCCDLDGGYWDGTSCYQPGSTEYEEQLCSNNGGYWDNLMCYDNEEQACNMQGGIYDGMCYEDPNEYCESYGMTWDGSSCYYDDPGVDDPGIEDLVSDFLLSHYDSDNDAFKFEVTEFADLFGGNLECHPEDDLCRTDHYLISDKDCAAIGGGSNGGGGCKFAIETVCYFLADQYGVEGSYYEGSCILGKGK